MSNFKKFIVLFSLFFVLVGYNFVYADGPVTDITPPVITLNGDSNISLTVGGTFSDPGATAIDNVDGSVKVLVSGSVDESKIGIYTITYTATDAASNTATVTRTVNINAPVLNSIAITSQANKINYSVGEALDITGLIITGTYSDNTTKAESITSTDITGFDSTIPVIGQTLTITVGTQKITYKVNINATPAIPNENIIIRNGDTVIYNGTIPLPSSSGTINIIDDSGVTHAVNADSVLGVIYSIGDKNGTFSISDLKDYGSMGLYLKCLTPQNKSPLCENWQYSVGSITPQTSIDTTILSGGETIGIYFGTSHQVVIDKTNINIGDTISATSEKYNYENNTWGPLTGVSIGLTLPNPKDTWNPTVVKTYPVDASGNTKITINNPNTYTLGIVEDYYFPSYTITVSQILGGGGGGPIVISPFNVSNALSYLSSMQDADGSFGNSLYTDWATIGIAASSTSSESLKTKIYSYLKNNPLNSSSVTDNERRAMALMSLDINPYSDTSINYIKKITDSFDGTQIGDSTLFNDDIFALIVLSKAGYVSSDNIISKDINYLISKQLSDGSWGSVDLTAAAIQALNNFRNIIGVSNSISKALNYLVKSQGIDGGFGNSFSTSWALQAFSTENGLYSTEIKSADDYLTSKQQNDGGVDDNSESIDNRIWATSYAIPAILNLSWNNILNSFTKPVVTQTPAPIITDIQDKEVIKTIPSISLSNQPNVNLKLTEDKNDIIKIPNKSATNKKPTLKNKVIKSKSSQKPIIKKIPQNNSTSKINTLSKPKQNIFLSTGLAIFLKIKDLFSWLFVRLGF